LINSALAKLREDSADDEDDSAIGVSTEADVSSDVASGENMTPAEPAAAEPAEPKLSLNEMRLNAVVSEVIASGAASVIDMGCGEGNLTKLLIREKQLSKVTAFDVSFTALERCKAKLKIENLHETLQNKLTLFQGSLIYRDKRFEGYDCACVVEVIEHLDESRLTAFSRVLFEFTKPKTVIITTPNVEYNAVYENMKDDQLRHGDHRFEWTRAQFEEWVCGISKTYGYTAKLKTVGETHEIYGSPTQMGVFTLCS